MPVKEGLVRVWSAVPEDVNAKIDLWAAKMGVTKSVLISLAVQSGIDSLVRAVSPVDAFSPEQLAAILKAAEKQGLEINFDDFIPKGAKHGKA